MGWLRAKHITAQYVVTKISFVAVNVIASPVTMAKTNSNALIVEIPGKSPVRCKALRSIVLLAGSRMGRNLRVA